jgi:xylan 1,4-beta-xylosidase
MNTATAYNPILPGFHPDPSVLRVGTDFYIATSSFEWYPGVLIYHSRDLARWQLVARPLDRCSLLDMRGNPDSCGIWAPCLSFRDGRFYLVYTDVKRFAGAFKDAHNYVVTAEDIRGPWSERAYMNSSGFDPSIFHDVDGRSWFLNMEWNHRPVRTQYPKDPRRYFSGILMQELDASRMALVGPVRKIFTGSSKGLTEGPHLYRRGDWYYLLVAEGGTSLEHAALFARARQIHGPYEPDPQGHLLASSHDPSCALKRAGHASMVDTEDGETFLAHLCSRPLAYRGRSVLGRETAIQRILWNEDGWPRLASGGVCPAAVVGTGLDGPADAPPLCDQLSDFDTATLPATFHSLRFPLGDIASLSVRPGWLRLSGRESLGSLFEQALLARRQQAFIYRATTCVDFQPNGFQQMAGLVCYYNGRKYFYLHITRDQQGGRILDLSVCDGDWHCDYPVADAVRLPADGLVWLSVEVDHDRVRFLYGLSESAKEWQALPGVYDYSILSDEVGEGGAHANFTGAFVGICCQDLSGTRQHADFDFFHYQELRSAPF